MKVTLLAHTQLSTEMLDEVLDHQTMLGMETPYGIDDGERLIEFAGRACYQSFHKPNPDTRSNADYLRNIIEQGHFSVLEHGSATFYLESVSRNLTHELIRHRHLSFSELSQRFVDVSKLGVIDPPGLMPPGLNRRYVADTYTYNNLVSEIEASGGTRKQAREAARFVLPSGMETKMVVTGNHRAWREVIAKRISPHADAEIQQLANILLYKLKEITPSVYQDM